MVVGLDTFKAHFKGFEDRYVLIGGTASSIGIAELGGEFRGTRDLDIVLTIESLDEDFSRAIWDFIKLGKYKNLQKSGEGEKRIFYRFNKPKDTSYPYMLEFFSRVPDAIEFKETEDSVFTPIPLEEELSSLSAILLNDDYYAFIHENKHVLYGLPVVTTNGLIPLKAYAHKNLVAMKDAGKSVKKVDLTKHKKDVFRLHSVLDQRVECLPADDIKSDMRDCFNLIRGEPPNLKDLKLLGDVEEILQELEEYYKL